MPMLSFDIDMFVSALILAATFAGIFTEGVHHIHRTKIAMVGAAAMVFAGQIFGFYGPEQAIEAIDWNVVFLLGAMMLIIAVMIPTGGFQAIAFYIARISGGRQFLLLAMLGTAVTLLSLLLDNVTTVVIFGPLIVLICEVLKVSPIPYLLAAALLTDTGGVATLIGDPPNLMIGSAADISFNAFLLRMGGVVLAAWLATLVALRFLFWKDLSVKPQVVKFAPDVRIDDPKTWWLSVKILGLMVVLFVIHRQLHWDAWVVATVGMTTLFLAGRHLQLDPYLEKVEYTLLLFFISLFVMVGGVEQSQFLQWLGQHIMPFVEHDLLVACLTLLWVSAILSAAIDNIPFTAAMIPIILSMESQGVNVAPLWWCLAMGVGMGGNGTHIGSTANVFIVTLSERLAQKERNPALAITPGLWFRKGTPAMLTTLVVCSVFVIMYFDFFSIPIHGGR
ncbi:MAG: ArsB/NhaD family transporter [Thiohalocapsa sp.]|uniref:SLC13 family permease n=1 Tax=Thiohalocapsa sp. TaxID=2497641 RepID=UPI0025D87A3D|nr:ArsB/NhaD family transporter [Thiohalocapsa sp.]MCG6941631.1 ArsB/NhaD family transporter [Thiohalocapsa sp.]